MLAGKLNTVLAHCGIKEQFAGKQIALFGVCVLAGLTCHLWLWNVSEPIDLFSDFYKAYYPAAEYVWQRGPRAGWPFANDGVGGFVNLPIVANIFIPLLLAEEAAAGWVFLGFGAAALMAAWFALARMNTGKPWAAAILALLFFVNGPLVNSLKEGNTTHFILLFVLSGILLWQAGADYWAGVVLGICALVKLPLLLLGVFFALTGRWKVVAGGATTIGLALIMSIAVHGWDTNVDWYKSTIGVFTGKVIPALNVQSLDAFLMRLYLGEKHLFDWMPQELAPAHRIVRMLAFAALAASLIALARWTVSQNERNGKQAHVTSADLLAFNIVLLLAILFSPVSWTHYYLLLLLPWSFCISGQVLLPDDRTTKVLMAASVVCCSLPVVTLPMEAGLLASVTVRTLVSAWFLGGLLCLAAMCRGFGGHAQHQDPTSAGR